MFSQLPTPRPDEKVIAIIEISAPDVATDSAQFADFTKRFTDFKQALDALVTTNFSGALKMKVIMKKEQQSGILFRN
jgi:hypothetical protein